MSAEAQALHDTLLVGDWHADSLLWKRDLLKRANRGQVDVPRLIEGNVIRQNKGTGFTDKQATVSLDAIVMQHVQFFHQGIRIF